MSCHKQRVLYVDNVASHYRKAIFLLMDEAFNCDYIFGADLDDIKQMDTSLLHGIVKKTKIRKLGGGWSWQPGVIGGLFKSYDRYLLIGDTRSLSTWIFAFLSRIIVPSKKTFFWSHGWYGKENRLERLLKKVFFKLPNGGVFLYGNHARELMKQEGFNADKLYVIHNSLDYDAQLTIRELIQTKPIYQDHFGNENRNIVFIGRLTTVKRFDLLIEAVALLKERGEQVNVTFIGDGVERQNMEAMVAEMSIRELVWFYGACYDEKTNAEMIFNADLCVSPGNIGLTAMHVLMFGCPAITNDDFSHQMPEFEAIQDGKTGTFFKSGDSISLADSISRWFAEHGKDRDQVRQACYKEIDTGWNPHNQIKLLKEVLSIK